MCMQTNHPTHTHTHTSTCTHRLGSVWGVTAPLPATGLRSSSPSWRWHSRLPLTHPSQVWLAVRV